MSRSSGRGQVEPLAALAAVLAVSAALVDLFSVVSSRSEQRYGIPNPSG